MKRLYRGIMTFSLCLSMASIITGCQEKESAQTIETVAVSTPAESSATEPKANPEPEKPVEQPQPPQAEEKKAGPSEKETPTKAAEAKAEPAAKPAPASAPTTKPVQTPTAPAVPKPSAPAKSEPAPQPVKQQIVTLSITGDKELGTILSSIEIVLEEGDTVLDVLKKATKEKKIQLEYRGSGAVSYVEGIDNLYEFDRGPKSGWVYRVNGVMGQKSAGAIVLKPNDRIEWLYTLDLGKDVE